MIINHNIAALNTYRQLSSVNNATSKSLERLSSGLRINRAGDDAAGLAISEKMRGQIRGLEQATRNAQDGISLIQTAEGALNETHSILQRMRELAVQSANDTNTSTDRAEIQKEVDQLAKELTRISNNTEFNTQNLLNGGIQTDNLGELTFHIGANADQSIALAINAMDAKTLGVARDILEGTVSGATDVTEASISGSAAAITDGNIITVSAAANFGGTVSADAINITSATAAEGGSVVDGASITISSAVNNPATAATKVADSALGSSVNFATDGANLQLNGVAIATTNVQALGDSYDAATNADTVATALESDIDAVYDGVANGGVTFTVVNNSGTLSIVNDATGSTSEVDLTGSDTTMAADLGFTNLGSVTGTDADYAVTFNDGTTSVTVNNVAGNAATVTGTGAYGTLSFDTGGTVDETTAGTITIGQTYTVTMTDGKNTDSVISSLAGDEATISGTGDFAGIELTTDGEFDENLKATITVSAETSSAATFTSGELTAEAVAAGGIDVSTQTAADTAVTTIQSAIETVSAERSKLGAYQNRLEHTINNLGTSAENLTAAESRIRDVDMAKEMMEFTKNNIIAQAATAMLAQANQTPQQVLQLLR